MCDHSSLHSCEHFREWTRVNGIIEDELEDDEEAKTPKESKYNSISYLKIPYPLTDNLCRLHRAYEAGEKSFPILLVPPFKPDQ